MAKKNNTHKFLMQDRTKQFTGYVPERCQKDGKNVTSSWPGHGIFLFFFLRKLMNGAQSPVIFPRSECIGGVHSLKRGTQDDVFN